MKVKRKGEKPLPPVVFMRRCLGSPDDNDLVGGTKPESLGIKNQRVRVGRYLLQEEVILVNETTVLRPDETVVSLKSKRRT